MENSIWKFIPEPQHPKLSLGSKTYVMKAVHIHDLKTIPQMNLAKTIEGSRVLEQKLLICDNYKGTQSEL